MQIAKPSDDDSVGVFSRIPVDSSEIEREAVIAMLERERRSLPSSLIAMALMALGVAMLPDVAFMAGLLALRLASFLFTRTAASMLERRVRARTPLKNSRRILILAMVLTGVTLALLLWPQPADSPLGAVRMIQLVVVVAVTLISVTLAALPRSVDAMLGSFWVTACALILFHPANGDLAMIGVVTLVLLGIRLYSSSAGLHMRSAAQILVENRQLSEDLADALAHAEFLSWRDPLTGLFNRRKLFEETRLDGSGLSRHLLTIDLDRFKAINDTYGHAVGDRVLIATADVIRDWCRALGEDGAHQCFRLGGEEFLVFARGFDDAEMIEAAEQLRGRIAELGQLFPDHPEIAISASIGLTCWRFGEGLDDALQRSDGACYEAKDHGRNRVRRAA
ncbi:diguanylate cyclase [Qipengyuania sp. YG27]|uniref:diguanylate cyclase n=1 Tax=Qipengyuania mesophila TaxID=2867246 RepID=A0ABS7JR51_9SPHN|nr:diguanylate cyclase [Qipengyuania mesophila]